MNPVRVLQVVPSLRQGGAERMMIHLIRGLDPVRYCGAVVSLADRQGSDLESMADAAGVEVWYLGKHPGFDPRMYRRLEHVFQRFQPDVVHSHLNSLLYLGPLASTRTVPAKIYTAHSFPELLVEPSLRWFYRACFRHGWLPVSIARALTPALRDAFRVAQMPMIPNGIPIAQFAGARRWRAAWRTHEGFTADDFLFVCVARFSEAKNHALLLKAFASIPEVSSASRLLLAGDGGLRESLLDLASQLGIRARVHFLGARTDIPELLAASDAFVLPSVQEANPLCVMEAMAAGLPVIATAVGGVPELIESGVHGILTTPGSVDHLAAAMSQTLGDRAFRLRLGENASRRAAQAFDVSHMVRAYDDLYCRALQEKTFVLPVAN